ncbi:serendipity locus protein delta-like isoform X2 [Cloeon dipterum]|uniref:serendipity locus protein delta-like isoform X2 n=1 Tax=Cloeon dipterum TaxID=197152 RepID=UPI00321F93C7
MPLKPPLLNGTQVPQIFVPPFRLVDLNVLALKLWCSTCVLPLSLRDCVEDVESLFRSELKVGCPKCFKVAFVPLTLMEENGKLSAYGSEDILGSKLAGKNSEPSIEIMESYSLVESATLLQNTEENKLEERWETIQDPPENVESHVQEESQEVEEIIEVKVEPEDEDIIVEEIVLAREERATTNIPAPRKRGRKQTLEAFRDECLPVVQVVPRSPLTVVYSSSSESDHNQDDDGHKAVRSGGNVRHVLIDYSSDNYESPSEAEASDVWEPEETDSDSEDWILDEEDMDSESDEEFRKLKRLNSGWMEKCIYCPLEFPNFLVASRHMRSEHPDYKALKCGLCNRKWKTAQGFNKHLYTHRPSKKRFFCEQCGTFWANLEKHMISHITEANFKCRECPAKLKTANRLWTHIKAVHKKCTCDFCHKVVGRKRIENHIRTHIGIKKRYECNICKARFVHRDNMKTHMRNNHNYVCLVCFKQFNCKPEQVQEHASKEHSAEEIKNSCVDGKNYEKVTRFQCQQCYRYLASKQSLQFHMNTHLKEGEPDGPQPKRRKKKGQES